MKMTSAWVLAGAVGAIACGSSDGDPRATDPGDSFPDGAATLGAQGYEPPPVEDGYTRIVAPVIPDIPPGGDVSHCQYVHAPFDRDMDILDLVGHQSPGGHHSLAYATTANEPVGTTRVCGENDDMQGAFLGGTGGEGVAVRLPEGVAFRVLAGQGIVLNTHFLNTTTETVQGETYLDFKFDEVDPARKVASFFSNGTTTLDVPAGESSEAVAECVLRDDMDFIFFTSHMHEYGTFGETELLRAGSSEPVTVHTDSTWTYENQFAPHWTKWDIEAPFTMKAGDTIRSTCRWDNTTDAELTFPREMCFGIGFYISDGSASPACLDGQYL